MLSPFMIKCYSTCIRISCFDKISPFFWDTFSSRLIPSPTKSLHLWLIWLSYYILYLVAILVRIISRLWDQESTNSNVSVVPRLIVDILYSSVLGLTVSLMILTLTKRDEICNFVNQLLSLDKKLRGKN